MRLPPPQWDRNQLTSFGSASSSRPPHCAADVRDTTSEIATTASRFHHSLNRGLSVDRDGPSTFHLNATPTPLIINSHNCFSGRVAIDASQRTSRLIDDRELRPDRPFSSTRLTRAQNACVAQRRLQKTGVVGASVLQQGVISCPELRTCQS